MANLLLLVILVYSFHEIKAQASISPELRVNSSAITETDSVTLNCQTPSSVSVSQCDFYIASQKLSKGSSCVQTLTGTELLKIAHRSLPAEVEVRCYYTVQNDAIKHKSPDSDASTINVNNLRPPKLAVSPPRITETDSVMLNCQAPSSVSGPRCYFLISGDKTAKTSPCLWTLTGSEFLSWTRQSSPVTVEVSCYYLYIQKSPVSNMAAITIQPPQPELTVNPQMITEPESVTVNCQTPSSVPVTECFLNFIRRRKSTSISCLQTLTGTELLSLAQQSSPAELEVTCFYMSERKGGQYQSPHSNRSSISIQMEKSTLTPAPPTSMKFTTHRLRRDTTAVEKRPLTAATPTHKFSRDTTAVKKSPLTTASPTSMKFTTHKLTSDTITVGLTSKELSTKSMISSVTTLMPSSVPYSSKFLVPVVATGFGVFMGILSLGVTLVCMKRRSGNFLHTRNFEQKGWLSPNNNEAYSMINCVHGADTPNASGQLNRQDSQNQNSAIYHVYATISEEPDVTPSTETDMAYSTLQLH